MSLGRESSLLGQTRIQPRPQGKGLVPREVEIVPTATTAPAPSESSSAGLADQRLGCIAFTHLLDQHPRRLTIDQLGRELGGHDLAALERAVASLDEACLVRRQGAELVPSPAALRIDRLA